MAKPTPALTEPMTITWMAERRSEPRVTRPFATPTAHRANRVQARLIASARLSEKKKYGHSGTIAAPRIGGADDDGIAERCTTGVG